MLCSDLPPSICSAIRTEEQLFSLKPVLLKLFINQSDNIWRRETGKWEGTNATWVREDSTAMNCCFESGKKDKWLFLISPSVAKACYPEPAEKSKLPHELVCTVQTSLNSDTGCKLGQYFTQNPSPVQIFINAKWKNACLCVSDIGTAQEFPLKQQKTIHFPVASNDLVLHFLWFGFDWVTQASLFILKYILALALTNAKEFNCNLLYHICDWHTKIDLIKEENVGEKNSSGKHSHPTHQFQLNPLIFESVVNQITVCFLFGHSDSEHSCSRSVDCKTDRIVQLLS